MGILKLTANEILEEFEASRQLCTSREVMKYNTNNERGIPESTENLLQTSVSTPNKSNDINFEDTELVHELIVESGINKAEELHETTSRVTPKIKLGAIDLKVEPVDTPKVVVTTNESVVHTNREPTNGTPSIKSGVTIDVQPNKNLKDIESLEEHVDKLIKNQRHSDVVPSKSSQEDNIGEISLEEFIVQRGGDIPLEDVLKYYTERVINKAIKNSDIIIYNNIKEGCKYVCV